jgi:hypothetical protein
VRADVLVFVVRRMLTRRFWFLVVASFCGALAMWVRSTIQNDFFQEAAGIVGRRFS